MTSRKSILALGLLRVSAPNFTFLHEITKKNQVRVGSSAKHLPNFCKRLWSSGPALGLTDALSADRMKRPRLEAFSLFTSRRDY